MKRNFWQLKCTSGDDRLESHGWIKSKNVIEEIEEKQLSRYGNVQQITKKIIPKQAMNWTSDRRKSGRPKCTWNQGIERATSKEIKSHATGTTEENGNWEPESARGIQFVTF